MIISFRTDRSRQTVQTQIRLLLEGSSLIRVFSVCYSICIFFDTIHKGLASFVEFYVDYSKVFWCPKIYELYGKPEVLNTFQGPLRILMNEKIMFDHLLHTFNKTTAKTEKKILAHFTL